MYSFFSLAIYTFSSLLVTSLSSLFKCLASYVLRYPFTGRAVAALSSCATLREVDAWPQNAVTIEVQKTAAGWQWRPCSGNPKTALKVALKIIHLSCVIKSRGDKKLKTNKFIARDNSVHDTPFTRVSTDVTKSPCGTNAFFNVKKKGVYFASETSGCNCRIRFKCFTSNFGVLRSKATLGLWGALWEWLRINFDHR